MHAIWRDLHRVGLLPDIPISDDLQSVIADTVSGKTPAADVSADSQERQSAITNTNDLLTHIIAAWQVAAQQRTGAARTHCLQTAARLNRWYDRGAELTCDLQSNSRDRCTRWLGQRFAWYPNGRPTGRRIGLISSRLGRDLNARRAWFTVLCATCMSLDPSRDLLVVAPAISTQPYVRRAGELFGIRVLEVILGDATDDRPEKWGKRILKTVPETVSAEPMVELSPRLQPPNEKTAIDEIPIADRAVAALSDRLIVLSARPGGNVQRLVDSYLTDPHSPPAAVYLALGDDLVSPRLANSWMTSGAVGWYMLEGQHQPQPEYEPPWAAHDGKPRITAAIRRLDPAKAWSFLTHWTRQRTGAWPDQKDMDYLDDLILDRDGADHSAFAAIWRIVQQRKLIATSDLIRGEVPVVCFTEIPLVDLPQRRSFRSHLGRWDFEPYGICLRRDWLQLQGAAPVIYGSDEMYGVMSDEQRPLFQKTRSITSSGQVIDWTEEREWRHVGDVSLDEMSPDAAFVFVPSMTEARALATISPWPVIVLE